MHNGFDRPQVGVHSIPAGKETVYAKVLVFVWKTGQATDGDSKNLATRMRYIAFQTSGVPAGTKSEALGATPIFSDDNPCYAYQCVYQAKGGNSRPVLVLLAK